MLHGHILLVFLTFLFLLLENIEELKKNSKRISWATLQNRYSEPESSEDTGSKSKHIMLKNPVLKLRQVNVCINNFFYLVK